MTPPNKNIPGRNDKMRSYVLTRDKHTCQWPGCGSTQKIDVLFLVDADNANFPETPAYTNGITLCPKHLEIVNLHDKAFGPLIYDLIQLVEFENDLHATERMYKEILSR